MSFRSLAASVCCEYNLNGLGFICGIWLTLQLIPSNMVSLPLFYISWRSFFSVALVVTYLVPTSLYMKLFERFSCIFGALSPQIMFLTGSANHETMHLNIKRHPQCCSHIFSFHCTCWKTLVCKRIQLLTCYRQLLTVKNTANRSCHAGLSLLPKSKTTFFPISAVWR